jgi:fused signal recognition particle receptor
MFKLLKDKLKGWISKTKEETEEVVTPIEEKQKIKEKKPKKKETNQNTKSKAPSKTDKKEHKDSKKESEKSKDQKITKKEESFPTSIKEFNVKTKKIKQDTKESTKNINNLNKELEKEPKKESEDEPKDKSEKEPEKVIEDNISKEKGGFFSNLFKRRQQVPEEPEKLKESQEPEEVKLAKEQEKLKESQEPEEPIQSEPKKSTFSFFRKSLSEEKFERLFEELEIILMQNNVAYEAIQSIKNSLKDKLVGSNDTNIEQALKESIKELLIDPPNFLEMIKEKNEKPFIILFAGINGSGKTTTIAKMTNLIKKNGFSVCLASADTFRAAAIEQLQIHADKLNVPLIKKDYGSDPASVGFDAVKYAKKNNLDVVLIDTAGRMNNRDSLMREIEKISRVNSPDLKIFLGESITGNDATEQARDFNQSIQIDGIILSKADVDQKGGTAISVSEVTKKPIYFLGTGQNYDDLEIFDKEKLIEKLFS